MTNLTARARANGICPRTLWNRVNNLGWDRERAATTPVLTDAQSARRGNSPWRRSNRFMFKQEK